MLYKEGQLRVRSTPIFKLKDKPGRNFVAIVLKDVFKFPPDSIVIERPAGTSNKIVVHAVLTPTEIEKEEKLEEAAKNKAKKGGGKDGSSNK